MSEPKFTKGKWKATIIDLEDYGVVAISNESKIIAQLNFGSKVTEEQKANANLFVSAPKMYKALEKIRSMCDGNISNENDIWHICNKTLNEAVFSL